MERFSVSLEGSCQVSWKTLTTGEKQADEDDCYMVEYLKARPAAKRVAQDVENGPAAKRVKVEVQDVPLKVMKVRKKRSAEAKDEDTRSGKKARWSLLDKAIQKLEETVTGCNFSSSTKSELPREVALKLEHVTKVAGSRSCDDDVVARLMTSMEQFSLRPSSLKQKINQIISSGEKRQAKLNQLREELRSMVVQRCNSGWDPQTEDKLYEYYDLSLEGAEGEQRGGLSKKFYTDVAELWPHGSMDKDGIKRAVLRVKKRLKIAKQP